MGDCFGRAFRKIVEDLAVDTEVTAVVYFGSVQRGEGNLGSDLDFFVVTTGQEYWRSAREIDGVAAELFHNPVLKMQQMLESGDQIALHAFAAGELVIDRTGEGRALVDLARRLWVSGPKPLTAEATARWRYRITALALDAEGLEEDSAEARLVAGMLVPLAMEGYCALNRLWADQPKHLIRRVSETCPGLAQMAADFCEQGMVPRVAMEIADRVLDPFGGRLAVYGTEVPCTVTVMSVGCAPDAQTGSAPPTTAQGATEAVSDQAHRAWLGGHLGTNPSLPAALCNGRCLSCQVPLSVHLFASSARPRECRSSVVAYFALCGQRGRCSGGGGARRRLLPGTIP